MKTRTALVASMLLLGGAYAAVQTSVKSPDERKASIDCWWTPSERQATVGWKFGSHDPGSGLVSGPTRNGPWHRQSKIKAGEIVHLDLRFLGGGSLTLPGMQRTCTVKAGANRETFFAKNHNALTVAVPAI